METKLGKAKPGFYRFIRKDPKSKSGRAYGTILVTGKLGYQGLRATQHIEFIPLDPEYEFYPYSESVTVLIETVSNKEGFDTIFGESL